MAAYAALVSLMHTIEQIQNHPRPPISLDKEQVDSLTRNVIFLQSFLEGYSSNGSIGEEDDLENLIAEAAYAAEDVIESHIADQFHAGSTSHGENIKMLEQIQHQSHLPISLDEEHVDSLTGDVTFLQSFLEDDSRNSSIEEDHLESRTAEAAYAAEDVIESNTTDLILAGSTSHRENISSVYLYRRLQEVIQKMDSLKKDVENVMRAQAQLQRNSSISTGSVGRSLLRQNNILVDFGDISNEIMDKLTGQPHHLQIIPIVGMGGMGKTTLARYIYNNPLIVQYFDIRAWVTVSHEYNRNKILHVICEQNNLINNDRQMSEVELEEKLRKKLWGRRYLIVMDDIWRSEAWDEVKSFFPDNNNGSRIMITTRRSDVASQLSGSRYFQMKFLDENRSWNLLCKIVFGEEGCPSALLEKLGKDISKYCRGLPLSIVVIGGLLAKSERTPQYWDYTVKNLIALINFENDKHCLQVLSMSYKELPIHLKPCFLHMGVFPEDYKIHVPDLIKLWVAEGFLKPSLGDKSLEIVAKEYFEELIDRNLILVHELRWNRKVKFCKIHDLLRDLCLIEAQKQRFLCVLRQRDLKIPTNINIAHRICIHKDAREQYFPQILHAVESASLTRSLLLISGSHEASLSSGYRLLRLYSRFAPSFVRESITVEAIFQQANLRHFFIEDDDCPFSRFPSPFSFLWNLQTLWIHRLEGNFSPNPTPIIAPSAIWKMPQLRHVRFSRGLKLPDPPSEEDVVLENLQTLSYICNFKCAEEVGKRIPNIRKLELYYTRLEEEASHNFCLNNLGRLRKLESLLLDLDLDLEFHRNNANREMLRSLAFAHSLKKLSLRNTKLQWDKLNTKIGSLPLLEVLRLQDRSCKGQWETIEGNFCSLKLLQIQSLPKFKHWTTESSDHFPLLEHLFLDDLPRLLEIPLAIGDIPTLQSIRLEGCSESAEKSARRIKEEQEKCGNYSLQVDIVEDEDENEDEDDDDDEEVAPQNLSPFQASDSLEFSAGGSFSLGSGGGDKSVEFPQLEIPSVIGDIPTLQSIRLEGCSESAEDSARRIKEEQEEYENDSLEVEIVGFSSEESNEDKDEACACLCIPLFSRLRLCAG